jgi:hypothetical protein
MIKATYSDRPLVVNILKASFDNNKSVNYLIPQDDKRDKRLRRFMEYSFDVCYSFGEVFLSDDRKGCALILLPDKKRTTPKSMLWDITFILCSIGLSNVSKALNRESQIKSRHPKEPLYYLWFIGVDVEAQNNGIGSKLLAEVIAKGEAQNRVVCLETSTLKNIPWYEKFGFTIYDELDLGYLLFFLKRG